MYDIDPGEEALIGDPAEDEAYKKYMKKWGRKLKKGKISHKEWTAAVNLWTKKVLEASMTMIANMEQ